MSRPSVLFSETMGGSKGGRIVSGEGVHLVLEDGRKVIDGTNTGGALGHAHPDIVAAVRKAASNPVVNDAWYWSERDAVVQKLAETAFADDPDSIGAVRFCLSGSEANDLALSLCQAMTGRTALATRERAYHGMVGLARDLTVQPHWHGGLSNVHGGVRAVPRSVPVRQLPTPETARILGPDVSPPQGISADDLRARAEELLADTACVLLDYTQGGFFHSPEYQDTVADVARRAGSFWIADEVVTGLGRGGRWFAFQGGESRPDMVTLGKPIAGGLAAAGVIVVSKEFAERLDEERWQTFSTFRGHPITVAAMGAFLDVMARDRLVDHLRDLDQVFYDAFSELAARHPSIHHIDGRGTVWWVELKGQDWRTWHGDGAEVPLASRVAARALEAGAQIGTSGESTSLLIAPAFLIDAEGVRRLVAAIDHGLAVADEAFEMSSAVR